MKPRPCTCDKFSLGQPYMEGIDCRQCWLFHHSAPCNKYWGGTGITTAPKKCKVKLKVNKTIGPGTALRNLLKDLGYTDEKGCACKTHAKQMDAWGADECERRMDEIVGWLRGEAQKQGKLFADFAARMVVWRAIQLSRASVPTAATLTADVPPWEVLPLLLTDKRPKFPAAAPTWGNFQEALAQARHRYPPRPWWAELET